MKKFKGYFKHLVEVEYEVELEAETKEEAEKLIEDSAFDFDVKELGELGIEIKDVEVEEIE